MHLVNGCLRKSTDLQEVGGRQNTESQIAHLQQKLQQVESHHQQQHAVDAEQQEALQAALTAARQETDVKANACQDQARLAHELQQRTEAAVSEERQLAERQRRLDVWEQRLKEERKQLKANFFFVLAMEMSTWEKQQHELAMDPATAEKRDGREEKKKRHARFMKASLVMVIQDQSTSKKRRRRDNT
ncbi:hypothetical protein WJX82_000569 [Trebouxia sp. C0006]